MTTIGLSIAATWIIWLIAVAFVIFLVVAVLPMLLLRKRPHRTWFQRSILALNTFIVVFAISAASGLTWFNGQLGTIERINPGQDVLQETTEPGEPENFLLVGVDNSSRLDEDDAVNQYRQQDTLKADTIMILRVIPESEKAHLLSIPRDLWVPIAGTGGLEKINTSLEVGGPKTLIETVEENFDIPIHHYVQVDFAGFREGIDALGGVPMYFQYPVRAATTGLNIDVAEVGECVTLDSEEALAFVRARRDFESYVDGEWVLDPSSDLGRMARQQVFMKEAAERAINRGARNPIFVQQLLDIGTDAMMVDQNLSNRDILDLSAQFQNFDPEAIQTYQLPVIPGDVGLQSVLFLVEEEAQDELNVFRGVSNSIPTLEGIRVSVLNGSGASGQASYVSKVLQDTGFTVIASADAETFDYETTVIRHTPETKLVAIYLARFLPGEVEYQEYQDLGGATVELVTGADYVGMLDTPRDLSEFEYLLDVDDSEELDAPETDDVEPDINFEYDGAPETTVAGAIPLQTDEYQC